MPITAVILPVLKGSLGVEPRYFVQDQRIQIKERDYNETITECACERPFMLSQGKWRMRRVERQQQRVHQHSGLVLETSIGAYVSIMHEERMPRTHAV